MNSPLPTPSISFLTRLTNSKKKKQYLVALIILILGAGIFFLLKSMKKPPEVKPVIDKTPIVTVQQITVGHKTLKVNSYGVVTPKYQADISAQVSGVIIELSDVFVRGGFVKQGQLLAKIDPSDYQAALLDAQAMVASAQAALEQEQAQGQVAKQEWQEITTAAPTQLSLRKPQLAQEQAKLKAAQASLLRAKRNLQRSEIRAPFDAIIEQRNIGLGSFVNSGTPVGKLLNTNVAQVRLPIPDKELQFLNNDGVGAEVTLSGQIANKQIQWQATIVRNEGVIDRTSRMHYLVAEISDPYQLALTLKQETSAASFIPPLRFGHYVNAAITGINIENIATVERAHLVNEQLPILINNNTLALLPIEVIRQEGSQLIITGDSLRHALNTEQTATAEYIDTTTLTQHLITSSIEQPVNGMALILASTTDAERSTEQEKIAFNKQTKTKTKTTAIAH